MPPLPFLVFEPVFSEEFSRALAEFDNSVKPVVSKKIQKVLENPRLGKPLRGRPLRYAERFSHYRIIYEIEGDRVLFLRIGERDSVYGGY